MVNFQNKKIVAIVPAFNEEKNVGEVLKVLLSSKYFSEVILVDDGSTDKTSAIGEKMGVKVVRLEKNGGKGNAMRKGVESVDAEIIIFFDADLTGLSKNHISLLSEPILSGKAAMCIGLRGRLWNLPKLIVKIDPLLAIGGERAVKKDLFEKISDKLLSGFSVETVLNYYCLKNKLSIEYVPLENLKMVIKEKKWGFVKGFSSRINMIFEIIKIRLTLIFHKNEFI
jgi:polyisoprenyl-phosphate glycosyltransferase